MKIDGNFSPISGLLMTYSYAQKHHNNLQHMLQELTDESRRMGLKMNIAKTKVMVVDSADRKCPRLRVLGTTLHLQEKEPGQRDTTKNHGRLGGIRQTPGYLQKQPCHLPEETGVQLLCAASYDIWCRDLDTDQTSTEQTCGRTDQNGKKYAQHHIQR